MAEGTEQVNRSAILYIVGSMGVVFSLLVMVMRSHSATTETVLQLIKDRADVSEEQRALTANRIRALDDQVKAQREEITGLRGRLAVAEARIIKMESGNASTH